MLEKHLQSTNQWKTATVWVREAKRVQRRRRILKTVTGVLLISIFAFTFLYPGFNPTRAINSPSCQTVPQSPNPPDVKRVALIDELATDQPDPGFVAGVNSTAHGSGYGFDYFPPNTANLDLFRTLPSRGYSVIIFRNHGPGVGVSDEPAIATSQPYDDYSWVWDQLDDRLAVMQVGGHLYFAITPKFVSDLMCGQFSGTIVMAMFCNSATFFVPILKSFVDKGARGFVGWKSSVSVPYDDLAFSRLIPLILQGETVSHAAQTVNLQLGPDPIYHGTLNAFPDQ